MINLKKACFAKYSKENLYNAILKIKKLTENGATQIEYNIITEIFCSDNDVEKIFSKGTIIDYNKIAVYGLNSISNNIGVWQCIMLSTNSKKVLIYTAGTSDILYYSFL